MFLYTGRNWYKRSPFLSLPIKTADAKSSPHESKSAGFALLVGHRAGSNRTVKLIFFPASVGESSQPHESSGDFNYLELDKWIRHCLIAKRRRQLLSDAESPATSSENDLWDRLLDLRVQVYTYVADFISMVTNHRLSRQRRSLLAMESRELAA